MSGLAPNPDKSHLFTCGVARNVKLQMLSILGYKEGSLPVRYLGVPPVSTRLKKADCNALVEKIIARARNFTSRALSYAGRVQLVKSILFAMQVYWSSLFILPKGVIKQVAQILRAFLWRGSELSYRGAKVAWENVCLPKREGGLGIKDVDSWNKAATLKHLWHLCTDDTNSVWSNWVRTYLIKSRNIWELKLSGECSWAWRKMMKLRHLARDKVIHLIGNGRSTSLWFDNWHPLGPLAIKYGKPFIANSGLGEDDKVEVLVEGSNWKWPSSHVWQDIIISTPQSFKPNATLEDRVKWAASSNGKFSTKSAWESIRHRGSIKQWHHLVWHRRAIPRHAMILWLAIWGKLNSQDKLISQGVIQANTCVLCNTHPEDLNHLFFSCDFSDFIWRSLWAKCSQTWSHRSWEDTVAWLSGNYHSSSLFCMVVRLMFAAAVYCIWREGNYRLFSRKSKNPSSVLQDIIFWVRSRVNPLGDLDPTQENRLLLSMWGFSETILKS